MDTFTSRLSHVYVIEISHIIHHVPEKRRYAEMTKNRIFGTHYIMLYRISTVKICCSSVVDNICVGPY